MDQGCPPGSHMNTIHSLSDSHAREQLCSTASLTGTSTSGVPGTLLQGLMAWASGRNNFQVNIAAWRVSSPRGLVPATHHRYPGTASELRTLLRIWCFTLNPGELSCHSGRNCAWGWHQGTASTRDSVALCTVRPSAGRRAQRLSGNTWVTEAVLEERCWVDRVPAPGHAPPTALQPANQCPPPTSVFFSFSFSFSLARRRPYLGSLAVLSVYH